MRINRWLFILKDKYNNFGVYKSCIFGYTVVHLWKYRILIRTH